jgi:sigma-E factor negative regulatory protein RseC
MEIGRVTEIKEDTAYVEFMSGEACNRCGARIICSPGASGKRSVAAKNIAGAHVGDSVGVEQPEMALIKMSFMQYGIPMLGFILATVAADQSGYVFGSFPRELFLFLSGFLGLLLGGVVARIWAKKLVNDVDMSFNVVEIRK